jgi:hypothetical protein
MAEYRNPASVGLEQAQNKLDGRGFTGSVMAEKSKHLPLFELKRQVRENLAPSAGQSIPERLTYSI